MTIPVHDIEDSVKFKVFVQRGKYTEYRCIVFHDIQAPRRGHLDFM